MQSWGHHPCTAESALVVLGTGPLECPEHGPPQFPLPPCTVCPGRGPPTPSRSLGLGRPADGAAAEGQEAGGPQQPGHCAGPTALKGLCGHREEPRAGAVGRGTGLGGPCATCMREADGTDQGRGRPCHGTDHSPPDPEHPERSALRVGWGPSWHSGYLCAPQLWEPTTAGPVPTGPLDSPGGSFLTCFVTSQGIL